MLTLLDSCYKLLHLEEDCSDLQLRQQYRKLALLSHPDKSENRNNHDFIKTTKAYKYIVQVRKKNKGTEQQMREMPKQEVWKAENQKEKDQERNSQPLNYKDQINRVYEDHLKIMEVLMERLKNMRKNVF